MKYTHDGIGGQNKKYKCYEATITLKEGYTIQFYNDVTSSFKVDKNIITSIKSYMSKEEVKTE